LCSLEKSGFYQYAQVVANGSLGQAGIWREIAYARLGSGARSYIDHEFQTR